MVATSERNRFFQPNYKQTWIHSQTFIRALVISLQRRSTPHDFRLPKLNHIALKPVTHVVMKYVHNPIKPLC